MEHEISMEGYRRAVMREGDRGSQRENQPFVGNMQGYGRTYWEGQRTDGRIRGNSDPFWVV